MRKTITGDFTAPTTLTRRLRYSNTATDTMGSVKICSLTSDSATALPICVGTKPVTAMLFFNRGRLSLFSREIGGRGRARTGDPLLANKAGQNTISFVWCRLHGKSAKFPLS
jgi:hypothetical protein